VAKVFRCPTDGRFLRPGIEYTLRTRNAATTVQYAHCPACEVLIAFLVATAAVEQGNQRARE
jgi:hypothetical protein